MGNSDIADLVRQFPALSPFEVFFFEEIHEHLFDLFCDLSVILYTDRQDVTSVHTHFPNKLSDKAIKCSLTADVGGIYQVQLNQQHLWQDVD